MAGTFSLIINALHSKIGGSVEDWIYWNGGATSPLTSANIVDAISICPDTKYARTLCLAGDVVGLYVTPGTDFYLDGVLTDRNNTPPGFMITDFSINPIFAAGTSNLFTITLKQLSRILSPTITAGAEVCGGSDGLRTYTVPIPSSIINHSLLHDQFGLEAICNSDAALWLTKIELTGNYITESWSHTLTVSPDDVAQPGDIITVMGDEEAISEVDDCDADGNSPFSITYTDPNGVVQTVPIPCDFILYRSSTEIRFILNPYPGTFIPYGSTPLELSVNVTSVEYTGSVSLLTLNQLLVDGSGIYKLNKNKTHDTYYDRTDPEAPVETDLKIPNPFIRTGYF